MSSFFGKLRSNAGNASPATGHTPTKKQDPNLPQPTPLDKLLLDAGPIRNDGSDKFYGMENFGNTCYCNSILQCLFYSVPFREQVINYPRRAPLETVLNDPDGNPRPITNGASLQNGSASATKPKPAGGPTSARNPGGPVTPQKPEDKDSPDYKKKQAMLAGPVLPLDYDNAPSYGMTESLFTSLKDIFEAIIANQSRTGVVSPTKFLEVLRKENEMFRTSMHQDAHEFLNLLLNEVVANVETKSKQIEADKATNGSIEQNKHESNSSGVAPMMSGTRTPTNTGWVHELFEGTLTSETKCLTCENVSQRDEPFLDLSVDLDQHSSVTSCLRKFSEEEMLCERNKFHCDMCGGLQEAEKRMKVKRLPKILALHLKRFKYTEDLQRLQKLFHRVMYPYHLRLFNTTDDADDADRLYELYAVVVHIGGGPYHGHYVAIIKTEDRGWLLFDDEMVEPVDKNYVRNFFGERPGLACAYVLFYQETTLEHVKREQEAEGLAAASQTYHVPLDDASSHGLGLSLKSNGLHHTQTAGNAISPVDEELVTPIDRSFTAPGASSSQATPSSRFSSTPVPNRTPLITSTTPSSKHTSNLSQASMPQTPITTTSPIPPTPTQPPMSHSRPISLPPTTSAPISRKEAPHPSSILKPPREVTTKPSKEDALSHKSSQKALKNSDKAAKKAAKEAEKVEEKAFRARRKENEAKKREEEHKAASEIKAAVEASRRSRHEDDKKRKSGVMQGDADSDRKGLIEKGSPAPPAAVTNGGRDTPTEKDKHGGGTLSRFRVGSKSVSKRLFGSGSHKDLGSVVKEAQAHKARPETEKQQQQHTVSSPASMPSATTPNRKPLPTPAEAATTSTATAQQDETPPPDVPPKDGLSSGSLIATSNGNGHGHGARADGAVGRSKTVSGVISSEGGGRRSSDREKSRRSMFAGLKKKKSEMFR